MSTTVTTHLRNQIQAAVDHGANHEGPLARSNTITDAVVATIEAHATCRHCPDPVADALQAERRRAAELGGRYHDVLDEEIAASLRTDRAYVAAYEAATRREERARIVWWLRAGEQGPGSVNAPDEYREAIRDMADVIEQHPDRFAEAPVDRFAEAPTTEAKP